jgi:hypothetical protein
MEQRDAGKTLIAVIVIGLIALMMVSCDTGPTYDTAGFHAAIEKANKSVESYNADQKEIDQIWEDAATAVAPKTNEGFTKAVGLLGAIDFKATEQKVELANSTEALEKALKLSLSEDQESYVKLLVDYFKKRAESNLLAIQHAQEYKKLVQSAADGTATDESLAAQQTTISSLESQAEALDKEAEDIKAKADKLYTEKKLGES